MTDPIIRPTDKTRKDIRREQRRLRDAKRGKPEHVQSVVFIAIKSLTNLLADPLNADLRRQVELNVARADEALKASDQGA